MKKFLFDNWFKLFICFMVFLAVMMYGYQTFVVIPNREIAKEVAKKNEIEENIKKVQSCISMAEMNYHLHWTNECSVRWKLKQECYKKDGVVYGKKFCEDVYLGIRSESDCSLPNEVAKSIQSSLNDEKAECHRQFDLVKK